MTTAPSVHDAVTTLHDAWIRRVERWQRLARQLPQVSPEERRRTVEAIVAEIDHHLLPYMRLEEESLEGADAPLIHLEHAAIRRGARRLRAVTTGEMGQVHELQAALASTCNALLDHLRHERTAYLPQLER